MTTIITRKKEYEFDLKIIGHAGYAAIGSDIVCSAISTLLQTLVLYLGDEGETFSSDIKKGAALVHGKGEKSMIAFNVVMEGFTAIANTYPEFVTLKEGAL